MAYTSTTTLPNSVVTKYMQEYYLVSAQNPGMWGQFIQWQDPITAGSGGSAFDFPVFGEIDPATEPLTETSDVTPVAMSDQNVTVTPREYGNVVAKTKLAELQARVNLARVIGEVVARNRIDSIDRILRKSIGYGSTMPTNTIYTSGVTMGGLSGATAAHRVSWAWLNELYMHARSIGMTPLDGENYVAIIHPLLEYDLKSLDEFKYVGYYQVRDNIYRGEVGMLANIRFVVSNMGRAHLGSGALVASGANTTLGAAASKGATSITVASATGISVGDYLTIGTYETESVNPAANLEQVLVTGVSGTTISIRGNGAGNSFGLRFDHANGEAVRESYNVASIPLIGKESLIGVYASESGQYGKAVVKEGLDYLNRFAYFGWWWYGGVGVVQKNIIVGRCAVAKWAIGYN